MSQGDWINQYLHSSVRKNDQTTATCIEILMDGGSEFILFEAPFLLNHGARDACVSPLVVVSLAKDCIFAQPSVNSCGLEIPQSRTKAES